MQEAASDDVFPQREEEEEAAEEQEPMEVEEEAIVSRGDSTFTCEESASSDAASAPATVVPSITVQVRKNLLSIIVSHI